MAPRIKRALNMRGLKIVLFAWGADNAPRLRNVAALRPDGSTQWTAELPADTGHDCFVRLEAIAGALLATTFSGHRLSLCPATGVQLN